MITVACVSWGNKFSEDYVHNLKSMVERNTTRPHQFVCFSDRQIKGIATVPLRPGFDGWWNKMQIFDTSHGLTNRMVYFDLDTLIVNNIDWLLDYNGVFMGIEDLGAVNSHQPHLRGVLQSGVMAWNYHLNSHIWETFIQNFNLMERYRGDGELLNQMIPSYSRDLMQRLYPGKIKSYKYQVYKGGIDDNLSIVCFHGRPSIVEAMTITVKTPRATFAPQSWIKDYWR
jgi:hypothetical protein